MTILLDNMAAVRRSDPGTSLNVKHTAYDRVVSFRPHGRRACVTAQTMLAPPAPPPSPPPAVAYAPAPAALTLCGVDRAAPATDEALMLAWIDGDLPAFQALYERHRRRLHGFLRRQLGDPGLAEEAFQDVWQRVIAARAGWRPEAAFATWLFRIAHNRLNDHWRAARHRPAAPIDAEERVRAVVDGHTPESELETGEQRGRLEQAMAALPAEQREVLHLRLEQELSLEAIAQITGVGRETVKSRLRYAMDKLRAALTP